MRSYRYLHLDVFTSTRLEGNQLAVVFDAPDLSGETMQATAREMAFSETVFVLPAVTAGATARLRIFTPARELPMAGHPTVGAAFALAHERRVRPSDATITLDLGVGPTPIGLEWSAERLAFAWMTQALPRFGAEVSDREACAVALGVDSCDLADTSPIQPVSCGLSFLFVPMTSREAVDRASLDAGRLEALRARTGVDDQGVFVFSTVTGDPAIHAYSRMFAPTLGVAEDPATGSATGPLGCYLVRHRLVGPEAQRRMVSLQGVKMQRPSRITMAIDGTPPEITNVRIGGASVLIAEGTVYL
jgi:trans-2,3-dihydro-3-hydroxyanthranilate isomerase